MQNDLRALAQRVSHEDAALQTVVRQVGRLSAQLASLRGDIDASLAARPLGAQSQQARAQLDKLCGRYEALCLANERARLEAEARRTELDELARAHAAASGTAGDLSAERAALETAHDEWVSAVQEEERALAESKRTTLELERQIAQRRRAIDASRREAEAVRVHNAKLTRQLDDSRRRIDKVARERSGAAEALALRQASAAEAERDLAHAHTDLDALHADRHALETAAARWLSFSQEREPALASRAAGTPRGARNGRTDAPERARADARETSASARRHNTPLRPRADADERERRAQLREEHGLLLQRESEWREYCRAVGRLPTERARAVTAGALDSSRQLQRENDRLREVIAQLARRAGEVV